MGESDRQDRKEATKLFAAVVVALVLLVLLGVGGVYYLTSALGASDPFSAGLDLKNAALVSLAVSLAVILVMAVASGGDAILANCRSPSPAS